MASWLAGMNSTITRANFAVAAERFLAQLAAHGLRPCHSHQGRTVDRAKRIATETEIALLIRSAPTKRDRLMLEVGYAGGLRVSELVALRWADVVPRDNGRVQLSVTGKGQRLRPVLLPASRSLLASRGEAGPDAPVFASRKCGAPLYPRAVNRMIKWGVAASTRPSRRTGSATRMRPTLSGAARLWARSATR